MMLYLYDITRPDIAFVVNFCARYMFFPKHFHEEALKITIWYLKLTRDHGSVFNLNREIFKIDSYPDSDFSTMYGHENLTEPICVKSCTSYVTILSDHPVLWQTKLQIETVLSTIEA